MNLIQELWETISKNWEFPATLGGGAISLWILKAKGLLNKFSPILKPIWIFISAPVKLVKAVEIITTKMEQQNQAINELSKKVEKIEKEFKDNGGSSLRDAVIRSGDWAHIANQKCNIAYDTSLKAVYESDPVTGLCTYANPMLEKLFGVSKSELLGKGWLAALHPEDIEPTWKKWTESLKNDIPYKARYRIVNPKTGEIIYAETTAHLLRGVSGKSLIVIGEVHEIKNNHSDFSD